MDKLYKYKIIPFCCAQPSLSLLCYHYAIPSLQCISGYDITINKNITKPNIQAGNLTFSD